MPNSSQHLELIFNLNDRLFNNTLLGMSEEQANERISDHNNPFIWIATHTVWARYNTIALFGKPVSNPYSGMFEGFKPFEATMTFPTIEEVKATWAKAGELLQEAFASATDEQLAAEAPYKNPIGDFTIGGTLAFFAQHESYDIGQLAFLKKFITREAMSYN